MSACLLIRQSLKEKPISVSVFLPEKKEFQYDGKNRSMIKGIFNIAKWIQVYEFWINFRPHYRGEEKIFLDQFQQSNHQKRFVV